MAAGIETGRSVRLVNLHDYEAAAREILSPAILDFIGGGAEDEATLRANRTAFDGWRLLPRVLRGIAEPKLETTVLGTTVSLPVLVAPMGGHRLVDPEGEAATARATKQIGTVSILSTASSVAMEEVAPYAGPWWFQLYVTSDRGICRDLVERAEASGAAAIALTADVPKLGRREANKRHGFELPAGVTFPHLLPTVARDGTLPDTPVPTFSQLTGWDPAVSWSDLDWLVNLTRLPVVVKGILHPDDAQEAVARGAKGVIVSNHGGRQLDQAVASLDALPAVADRIGDRAEIFLDGGVRRGTDVIKALALGARAVCIGRPVMWALAVGGEAGVAEVLDMLRQELLLDLLLCGKGSINEVDRNLVVPVGPIGAR